MKIWLSRNSEVPLQEQLSTQLVLGIVSADLAAGERLPSTRELARRFQIHPNTVSAAYRALLKSGWLEWRKGSGFYVRPLNPEASAHSDLDLDRLISTFFQLARTQGYTLNEIQSRIQRWFSLQPPDHVALIEPDPELRRILIAEISRQTSMRVVGMDERECSKPENLIGAFCVALYDSAKLIRGTLPPEISCLFLRSRSISRSLTGELKPPADSVIHVISRWPDFLRWARTVLIAADVPPAAIDLRDATRKGWKSGLNPRSFIITDSLLSQRFPGKLSVRVFRVISDESIAELKKQLQELPQFDTKRP